MMSMKRTIVALSAGAIVMIVSSVPASAERVTDRLASRAGVIVWTTQPGDGSEHLMIAPADGRSSRELTPARPGIVDVDARISADGKWVVFERDDPTSASIHLIRPDGTHDHEIKLGCVDPGVAVGAPTWLSNQRVAYIKVSGPFDPQTGNAASAVLWSARTDGSSIRRLSPAGIDGVYEDARAAVSRDHSYIAFTRTRDSDHASAIFRMAADGSDLRQLTPWDLAPDVFGLSQARHGPTADLIVFESYGRGNPAATFVDLATVPATCTPLTDCASKIHWITDNATTGRRNANPQWSPDGSSLVFTNRSGIDNPNADIWTMRYGGITRTQISTSTNFDYRPAWGRQAD
jgi:Tol biopolymer transport system component